MILRKVRQYERTALGDINNSKPSRKYDFVCVRVCVWERERESGREEKMPEAILWISLF
jgi:hypothetical protein